MAVILWLPSKFLFKRFKQCFNVKVIIFNIDFAINTKKPIVWTLIHGLNINEL